MLKNVSSTLSNLSKIRFVYIYTLYRPYTLYGALRESQVKEMQIFQNKCLRLALGVTYLDRMRTIDLHDLTNVPMIKTRMTALAVKTFRSLENTQCFKDLVLNHEIVQKRSGSNTILDQLLAEIQADA